MQPNLQLADYFAPIGAGYAQDQSLYDDLGVGLATLDLYKTLLKPSPVSYNTMGAVSAYFDFGPAGWYIGVLKRLAQEKYEDEVVRNLYSNLGSGTLTSVLSYLGAQPFFGAQSFAPYSAGCLAAPAYIVPPFNPAQYFTSSPDSYLVNTLDSSEESAIGAETLAELQAQSIVCSWKNITRFRRTVCSAVALARLIRKLLYRGVTLFCSVPWEHRTWFLLHGSHPPKDSILAYSTGCAVLAT